MYLDARVPEFPGKPKLICELTEARNSKYKEIIKECFEKAKIPGATKASILKEFNALLA